jgi:hypothetical protein
MNLHEFLTAQHWCVADPTGILVPLTKDDAATKTTTDPQAGAGNDRNNQSTTGQAPGQPPSQTSSLCASVRRTDNRAHTRVIHPLRHQPVFEDVASQAAHEANVARGIESQREGNRHGPGMDAAMSSQQSASSTNSQTRQARHVVFNGTCCFVSRGRACRFQESGGDGSVLENVGFCVTTSGFLKIRFTANLVVGVLTQHIKQVKASPHSSHRFQHGHSEQSDQFSQRELNQSQQQHGHSGGGPPVTTLEFRNGALQLWPARQEDGPAFLRFLGALQHQMKWPKSASDVFEMCNDLSPSVARSIAVGKSESVLRCAPDNVYQPASQPASLPARQSEARIFV